MPNSFDYEEMPYTCRACGWSGLGKDLASGDYFEDLFETNCPSCGGRMGVVTYPTIEECRAHEDQLHPLDRLQVDLKEAVRDGKISQDVAETKFVVAVRNRYPGNSWEEVSRDVDDFKASQHQATAPESDDPEGLATVS